MVPIPEETFANRLRDLPPDQIISFVADLWTARGYETQIKGDNVIVSRDNEREQLICRPHIGRWQGSLVRWIYRDRWMSFSEKSADIVVTTASPRKVRQLDEQLEPRVIGAETLRDLVLYAVDPQRGDTLCRKYLGRPARLPVETDRTAQTVIRGGRIAVLGVIGLTILFLAGAIIGSPDASGLFGNMTQSTETRPTATVMPTSQLSPKPTAIPGSEVSSLPPGLSETGITDPKALIDNHIKNIAGHSYTWTLTYQVFIRGDRSINIREVIRVRGPSRYVTNISGDTVQTGQLDPTTSISAYGSDGVRYVKINRENETEYRQIPIAYQNDTTRYATRARVLLEKYLIGNYSATLGKERQDGEQVYILRLVNKAFSENVSTRTTVVISSNGVIKNLQRRYVAPKSNEITIVVSFQYTNIGSTRVKAPPWYEAAKNTTA